MKGLQIPVILLAVATLATITKVIMLEMAVDRLEAAPPCPCEQVPVHPDDFLLRGDNEPTPSGRKVR